MHAQMQSPVGALLFAVLLAACQPAPTPMTPEETQRIQQITQRMTPRCVGRYLVDMPESFDLHPIHNARIEGVRIEIVPMSRSLFDMNFKSREESLRTAMLIVDKKPALKSLTPVSNGAPGGVFDRSKDGATGLERTLEIVAWREGFELNLQIDARDADYWPIGGDPGKTTTPEKLTKLMSVFERTRGRADHEVPQEQGICFANGFVRGPATDEESILLHYQYREAPDGGFSIYHKSDIGPEETTLLERSAAIERNLKTVDGKTFRKGKVEPGGLKGEEYLFQRREEDGNRLMMYDFKIEMGSKTGDAAEPLFIFEFGSGMEPPPPRNQTLDQSASRKPLTKVAFNEAESIAIWDKVSVTLRKRPGAF